MQFKALSLALVASTATPALSCTLAIWLNHNASLSGDNNVKCEARIYDSDSPDLFNDWADQAESFSCGGGCVDVTRNGEVYHFCVDGTGSMEIQGEATVSSDLAGDINIYPDGETWKSSQSAYLGSNNSHAFYVTGAKCPA